MKLSKEIIFIEPDNGKEVAKWSAPNEEKPHFTFYVNDVGRQLCKPYEEIKVNPYILVMPDDSYYAFAFYEPEQIDELIGVLQKLKENL